MTLRATYRDELETLRQHVERLEESLRDVIRRRDERHRANGTGPYAPGAFQRGMYRLGQRVARALRRSPEARHESALARARARVAELERMVRMVGDP